MFRNCYQFKIIRLMVGGLAIVAVAGLQGVSPAHAQSTSTAVPLEAAVRSYSNAQASYLRVYNASGQAGTVTVTLSDFGSGRVLGQWTSPSIPPSASQQFPVGTIESIVVPEAARPAFYNVTLRATFDGLFQHVAYQATDGTLSNLTACRDGITAPSSLLTNVSSSSSAGGLPGYIVVNNTGLTEASTTVGVYNAQTGDKLGSFTTPLINAGAGVAIPIGTVESGAGFGSAGSGVSQYNLKIESAFSGYLQYRAQNSSGTVSDMTGVCKISASASASGQVAGITIKSSVVTASAAAEQKSICASNKYPAQWEWDASLTVSQPQPASSGTPKVEQYRDGILIATYASLGSGKSCSIPQNAATKPKLIPPNCGPFGRVHSYRTWQPGDLFLVYPAVYDGGENQPWIGAIYDNDAEYSAGITHIPTNITVRGVTVNGVRPVLKASSASYNTLNQTAFYLADSVGVTIENIDIDTEGATQGGKALIYVNGAKDATFRDMRIHGGQLFSGNGILGTNSNSGVLKFERVEFFNNGGPNGPAHNLYISESASDPDYTLYFLNSWSHDSKFGHLLKSRAQVTKVEGSYLSGSVPSGQFPQTEPYLLDVPDGGRLTVRNTVFVKNASGYNSNGILLAYAMEKLTTGRVNTATLENNTFVTFTNLFDGVHQVTPIIFAGSNSTPGASGFPAITTSVRRNVFVGFCPASTAASNYRGDLSVTAAFSELSKDYALTGNYSSDDTSILGTPMYKHRTQTDVRRTTAIGAQD